MERKGDWMTTYTGRQFWPLDPRSDEVYIEDIAHALSLMCRFGGHCKTFYSVAQHSCLVSDLVFDREPGYALDALLHDAAEAYIGDIIRPLKRWFKQCVGYDEVESRVMAAVWQRYRRRILPHDLIKWADDLALKNEHKYLIQDGKVWGVDSVDGPDIHIVPVSPTEAETTFLHKFKLYGGK